MTYQFDATRKYVKKEGMLYGGICKKYFGFDWEYPSYGSDKYRERIRTGSEGSGKT